MWRTRMREINLLNNFATQDTITGYRAEISGNSGSSPIVQCSCAQDGPKEMERY